MVLGCPNWFEEATKLLDYGFEHYKLYTALQKGDTAAEASILNGHKASVSAIAEEDLAAAVKKNQQPKLEIDLDTLSAPLESGRQIGTAYLRLNGETIAQTALTAAEAVEKRSIAASFRSIIQSWLLTPA